MYSSMHLDRGCVKGVHGQGCVTASEAVGAHPTGMHSGYKSDSSPFTVNAWWFSPQGFLPPSEGLEIVLIGTAS